MPSLTEGGPPPHHHLKPPASTPSSPKTDPAPGAYLAPSLVPEMLGGESGAGGQAREGTTPKAKALIHQQPQPVSGSQ